MSSASQLVPPSSQPLLFVCDHAFDPRLERKLRWLKELFENIIVVRDASRTVHGKELMEDGVEYIDYSQCAQQLDRHKHGVIYVAGNKVLRDHSSLLRQATLQHSIVWEIADLPLRKGFPVDLFVGAMFRHYLRRVNPHFVVTAPGFMRWLPGGRPWLLSENVPEIRFAESLYEIPASDLTTKQPIRVGFPGVIRFLGPLVMLHRFMCEHPNLLQLHIWGGAQTAWNLLQQKCRQDQGSLNDVHYHGPYTLREHGLDIYSALDVVWAVYDGRQTNVKVALPNRFYEAVLAGRWLLAADGTEVSNRVSELAVGHSLPSKTKDYNRFAQQLLAAIADIRQRNYPMAARDKILTITRESRPQFLDFIRQVVT